LAVQGSSFLGCLSVNDFDGNGKMDLAGSGGLIQQGDTYLYLWTSDFPYAKARAPLPTYQYNLRRDGIADPMAMALLTGTDTLPSQGGSIDYYLDATADNAQRNYLLLGSVSGTDPGTPLPGGQATLPLNWDLFTNITVLYTNTPVFKDFMGTLDQGGKAGAQLNIGPVPGFVGTIMYFAYALNQPLDFASNPVKVTIVP
jgi:hypothetical protein